MKSSEETKADYVKTLNETKINIKKDVDFVKINNHFVGTPFFEITANFNDEFKVDFLVDDDKVHSTTLSSNMWTRLNKKYYRDYTIKVSKNGELIYDEKINLKNKRVFITLESSSLGDSIAWVPYAEEFRKKHGCVLIISTFWNHLFEKTYPNLEFVKPGITVNNLYAMYSLGWFYNEDMEPELPNTIPLQKAATNILGLEFKEIKTEVNFNPKEKPYLEKYVTIAPHSTSGLKYWNNKTGWEEVVSFLTKNGYKVINVSKEGCDIKGVETIKDTSIDNTMNVIHHSEFFIGLSSGLSWLAWGINKHVVMISNFTEKDHEFTINTTRITNDSVCNGCWNKPQFKFDKGDWNWCPEHKNTDRQFECHKSITGEMVIKQIKNLLK